MLTDPEELMGQIKRRIAVHEAAHAVVAYEIGWEVIFIEMLDTVPGDVQHADLWAFTRVNPGLGGMEIEDVVHFLAGHVAERLFAPKDDEIDEDFGPGVDVLNYIDLLREGDIAGDGDFAATWDLLEFNLDLPLTDPDAFVDEDVEGEREAAFAWAVLRTCRVVLPLRDKILRVAELVEALEGGGRLDGADIVAVLS
jgi:hypothetical protein